MAQSEYRDSGTDNARDALFRIVRGISISSDSRETVDAGVSGGHQRTASHFEANSGSSDCQVPSLGILPHYLLALGGLADEPDTSNDVSNLCYDGGVAGNWLVRREPFSRLS